MPVKRRTHQEHPADDSYKTTDDEVFDEEDVEEPEEDEEPYEDEEDLDDDRPQQRTRRPGRRSRVLSAATAGVTGLRQIAELTSKDTEGVTQVRPAEDGWLVDVEVVEDRHIPSSGDMLALYQVQLDPEGDLLSYRRVRRYRRGRADSGEGG
ncbi:gas vesicle protein GvpO [Streptosporangium sp. NPDC049644]|uniref:gas vesicle protein GvpO n=1 Tax=Streptosporangium sp. NPDC049644 TaxID=3155507 RepID=UPI0034396320